MAQSPSLRLQKIVVEGLFGTYDHEINLRLKDRVTLLHGPNGVGKTVILGMIDALLRKRFDYFKGIPFSRFSLQFHDRSTIDLKANVETKPADRPFKLTLMRRGEHHEAMVGSATKIAAIAAKKRYLSPHPQIRHAWVDIRDGEVLSGSEVVRRYGGAVSASEFHDDEYIGWFSRFLKHANAHLIEAQRLVTLDSDFRREYRHLGRHRPAHMDPTVVSYSRDFSKRLADTMAQYGRQSQVLDQSFPQRLMAAEENLELLELQDRLAELDEKTAKYKSMGILDETPAHPLTASSLEPIGRTQARVMTLYVQDTEKKLRALDDLATRTRLLLENVNRKYRHKQIHLDREEGFIATSDIGQPLPLSSLSSGEQQELVLHYDLLFRVPSNTIVLIDEPELSLHVAWQKKFLPDLLKIVDLSNFDALVATHSPYVVGDRPDLMIGLGD